MQARKLVLGSNYINQGYRNKQSTTTLRVHLVTLCTERYCWSAQSPCLTASAGRMLMRL